MTGFGPTAPGPILATLGLAAAVVALAPWIAALPRLQRLAGWTLAVLTTVACEGWTRSESAGLRMLAICSVLFLAMKAMVLIEFRRRESGGLGLRAWLAFALLSHSMRPRSFVQQHDAERSH